MNDMKEMLGMKACKVKIMIEYAHVYEDVRCPKHKHVNTMNDTKH